MGQDLTVARIAEVAQGIFTQDGCKKQEIERHLELIRHSKAAEQAVLLLSRILRQKYDYSEQELREAFHDAGILPKESTMTLSSTTTPQMIEQATRTIILLDFTEGDIAEEVASVGQCESAFEAILRAFWVLGTYPISIDETKRAFIDQGILEETA
jgi:hypothetical protein